MSNMDELNANAYCNEITLHLYSCLCFSPVTLSLSLALWLRLCLPLFVSLSENVDTFPPSAFVSVHALSISLHLVYHMLCSCVELTFELDSFEEVSSFGIFEATNLMLDQYYTHFNFISTEIECSFVVGMLVYWMRESREMSNVSFSMWPIFGNSK